MSTRDRAILRQVIDELANALQTAIGLATRLRRETQATADGTIDLEAAIGRAIAALRRLHPTRKGGDA